MSAYVVPKAVVDVLVAAAIQAGLSSTDRADLLGQALLDQCVISVRRRYPDDRVDELPGTYEDETLSTGQWQTPYVYREPVPTAEGKYPYPGSWLPGEGGQDGETWAVVVGRAIQEFDYQACEDPDWGQSAPYRLLLELRTGSRVAS